MSNQPNNGQGYSRGYGQNYGRGYDQGYTEDQTRVFNNQSGYGNQAGYNQNYDQGYGANYDQGYGQGYQYSQGYQGQELRNAHDGRGGRDNSGLLAGRFDGKRVAINLIVLAVLAAAVTFAVVFVVDLLVGMLPNQFSSGTSAAGLAAVIAGAVGVLAGLLYIPVSGTGNENLYGMAVIALAVVAIILWVVLGGLLDGDWSTLVTLAGIICTAAIARLAPSRIESAAVR